ncbi:MAG: GTP-binding protein [Candidatus Lokiarchaeota archaeon]|nr:GTP-binding protein [Candidatus Lokiarchaeota archaeon]
MSNLYNEINIKAILLGTGGVGKTSLVNVLTGDDAPERYMPTIGSNIKRKDYKIKSMDYLVSVSVWDFGGQRSFNPLNPVVFSNVDIAFLLFDLSQPDRTLEEIKNYYIPKLMERSEECITFLIGNKLDLFQEEAELKNIVKKYELHYTPLIFTSAITAQNVIEALEFALYKYLGGIQDIFPEQDIPDLKDSFLEVIDKTEEDFKSILVNLSEVDSFKMQKKSRLDIKKKKIDDQEEYFDDLQLIREKIKDLDAIRQEIKNDFSENISSIEYLIRNLRKTPIHSLIEGINATTDQLKFMKEDFELKLDSLLDINNLFKNEKDQITELNTQSEITSD